MLIQEEFTDQARSLWSLWIESDTEVIAPLLFPFEVTAVLRKKVYRNLIQQEEAESVLREALEANIGFLYPPGLHRRAWELATRLNRPTAYDAHYLALAEMLGCEFWTADRRLYDAVHEELRWVRWLGNYEPPVFSTSATIRS